MKFHFCSAYNEHNALDKFLHTATLDQNKEHQLCDSAEEADIILFIEDAHFEDYLYSQLLRHQFIEHWPDKCYMYNEVDRPWSTLPGLYCSMPRWSFDHNRQRAFPYAATPNQRIQDIYTENETSERALLFSFVGTACNTLRKRMIKAGHDQGGTIIDTSGFNVWDCSAEEKRRQGDSFADTIQQSKFVLCPRGLGSSSFRLYETMQAGRAPVIIADSWVEPKHCDWSFAVRLRENELGMLAERLESIADEAVERGKAAREAWQKSYAPDQIFHTICQDLSDLKANTAPAQATLRTLARREQVRLDTIIMQAISRLRIYQRRLSNT